MRWGLFNSEGLLETFANRDDAERGLSERRDENGVRDPDAYAGPLCPEHPDECAWHCRECNPDNEED